MNSRKDKRKTERFLKSIANKAKKDMGEWLETLGHHPTPDEIIAWKAGYIAGINRNKDKE